MIYFAWKKMKCNLWSYWKDTMSGNGDGNIRIVKQDKKYCFIYTNVEAGAEGIAF